MTYLFFINKSQAITIEPPTLEVVAELLPGDLRVMSPFDVIVELVEPTIYAGTPDTTLDLLVLETTITLIMPYVSIGSGGRAWWYYDMIREGE